MMSQKDASTSDILRALSLGETDSTDYPRVPPYDSIELVGKTNDPFNTVSADLATGDCHCNTSRYENNPDGKTSIGLYNEKSAGFNCIFNFDRPWERYVIYTNMTFREASVMYELKDRTLGLNISCSMHVECGSSIAIWKRVDDQWKGIGGLDNKLCSVDEEWVRFSLGGDRSDYKSWKDKYMGMECSLTEPISAGQDIMVRASLYARLRGDLNGYAFKSQIIIMSNIEKIRFIGLD